MQIFEFSEQVDVDLESSFQRIVERGFLHELEAVKKLDLWLDIGIQCAMAEHWQSSIASNDREIASGFCFIPCGSRIFCTSSTLRTSSDRV